jgi:phage/plasmid-associated DNA primase
VLELGHLDSSASLTTISALWYGRAGLLRESCLDEKFVLELGHLDSSASLTTISALSYGRAGLLRESCLDENFVRPPGLLRKLCSKARVSAGNGKGVLKEMVQATIGSYFGIMSKDAVVTPPGQRAASKNAPTNYLFELIGKRFAITDETNENERVDLCLVLSMTGGGKAKARPLYGNNVEFVITHTPIVQTNYAPELKTVEVKANIKRRLRVIPFPNEYVAPEYFDPDNGTHCPVDTRLKARMLEEETCQELLSWLARGSRDWYKSHCGLGDPPTPVKLATAEFLAEADKLPVFLNVHCIMEPAAQTTQYELIVAFQQFSNERVSAEDLARRMAAKGFTRRKNNGQPRQFYYPGLECTYAA